MYSPVFTFYPFAGDRDELSKKNLGKIRNLKRNGISSRERDAILAHHDYRQVAIR